MPAAGEVVVQVRAASLNYLDLLIVQGHYDPQLPLPHVPVADAAGTVVAVGAGVTAWAAGDEVVSIFLPGWRQGTPTPAQVANSTRPGVGRFRVPTLRNIALTAPYMHDGRLATLPVVLDHYSDHVRASPVLSPELVPARAGGLGLTATDKADLLSFLALLTNSSFVTNPQLADPHVRRSIDKK